MDKVIIDGVSVTREQIERAYERIQADDKAKQRVSSVAHLDRVRRIFCAGRPDLVGVVIKGPVQEYYAKGYGAGIAGFPAQSIKMLVTVVSSDGHGYSYPDDAELLTSWELAQEEPGKIGEEGCPVCRHGRIAESITLGMLACLNCGAVFHAPAYWRRVPAPKQVAK